MALFRACINRRCGDEIHPALIFPMCPSCRYVGKWCLGIGAFIAGVLMKMFGG